MLNFLINLFFKKVFARIHFIGYFQEIWDWKMSFTEWKGTNIVNKHSQPTESKITLCLKTYNNKLKNKIMVYKKDKMF